MQKLDWNLIDIQGIRAIKGALASAKGVPERLRLQASLDADVLKYGTILKSLERDWVFYEDEAELKKFYDGVVYAYLLAGGHMAGMDIRYYEKRYYEIP